MPSFVASSPQSAVVGSNIHMSPSRNENQLKGASLAQRVSLGNKDACTALLSKLNDLPEKHELRDRVKELVNLIDKARSFEPFAEAEVNRKEYLQNIIPKEMNDININSKVNS